MKARLYKGPFSGKVIEHDGSHEIIVTGPKRMTRKQRYELEREQYSRIQYTGYPRIPAVPMVRARYRMCRIPVTSQKIIDPNDMAVYSGYAIQPLVHPDGSVFYEFVEKREL